MNLVRRTAFVAIAVAIVVGFGAAAYLLVPWKGDTDADAATGAPKVRPTGNGRFKLVACPPPSATGIPPETTINVDAQNGRIKHLAVKAPDGTAVPGYLDARRRVVADEDARSRPAPRTRSPRRSSRTAARRTRETLDVHHGHADRGSRRARRSR